LGIFYDLAEVFHCVNRDIWLSKLNVYRKIGKANEWMKSYLRIGIRNWREKEELRVIMHFQTGEFW
jgi:hypothetical protein